jgi:RNA 2',3'-cyclic 3'-phosphodiesterase
LRLPATRRHERKDPHTTAVVLIPPEAVWEPIQAIRRQHDRNARRWMPHITLLYPFAPQAAFAKLVPDLAAACVDIAPFTVTLASFDVFTHGRRGATLFLVPEPASRLLALQDQLWQAAPAYDDARRHPNGFTPHLSVGQAPRSAAADTVQEALAATWQPIAFRAEAVQLIARGEPPDDRFRVIHTIALGTSEGEGGNGGTDRGRDQSPV